jgi:predicted flap endonuclease-1-like 5' DNA nuclease
VKGEATVPKKLEPSDDLPNIGSPARRALVNAGFTRLEELTRISEADLSKLHGMGPKAIRILREALEAKGLSFASH